MNIQALSRKLLRLSARAGRSNTLPTGIEPLESRIAPATLVSPTTVTFQDKTGDNVTVTISKPLFTAANVSKVFTFDTGSVNGVNTVGQQLELLNITKLGSQADGINLSITAVPVNSSPGIVNVGYINASNINLGDVSVGGDLGRINAGDIHLSGPALHSLTVNSIGVQGLATQAPKGNLNSNISGAVGTITVNGDINGAAIGIGGGAKGTLGTLTVTGSIIGGATAFSGSVRTQGAIGTVEVDGNITGGGGANSGIIGTASSISSVVVESNVTGGGGNFSGAVLSTKSMASVQVDGNIIGGNGNNSGQVGTAGVLTSVIVEGSVNGGSGKASGDILATGNITLVAIDGNLVGGSGVGSGEIGSGASIQTVNIDGSMTAGAGIHAFQNITSVGINDGISYPLSNNGLSTRHAIQPQDTKSGSGLGIADSFIDADKGSIGSIEADSSGANPALNNATISAGMGIGLIDATATSYTAIFKSQVSAGGSITELNINSEEGVAIADSQFFAGQTIGTIIANGTNEGINGSIFRSGKGIGSITANAPDSGNSNFSAIDGSGFDTGGNIGTINTTGPISGSVFVAGFDLGVNFAVSNPGTFNNTTATALGFGSSHSNVAATIGDITVSGGEGGIPAFIGASTFLAGVHGSGVDKTFGTKDDLVAVGSSIGTITAPGGLESVYVESGSIGATNSGEITNTTYLATDTAVTAGGIGPITIIAQIIGQVNGIVHSHSSALPADEGGTDTSHGIFNSTFTTNAGIGAINVTLSGTRASGENAGISGSSFIAGHALGAITVNNGASGGGGTNYGIINSTFNGGINGYGGSGDINVTLTDTGSEGNSVAISGVQIDASVCSCMSANMGAISAENDNTGSGAAGIVDSAFRVHGSISSISAISYSSDTLAAAIQGSTFSAFGSIGPINVYGSVIGDTNGPSRFLAGYDIGTDMTFGNEDLGSKSLALQGSQSVGDVTVTGYFQGSDIAASINPGTGYVFGDSVPGTSSSNDANIGAGGSIGYVSLGTNLSPANNPFDFDYATSHGIEAASFPTGGTPPVSFGMNSTYTSGVPVVLYVDGGSNDVRITDLTFQQSS